MIGRRAVAIEDQADELHAQLADFFTEHYDRLVKLAALVCHSEASVEDAVQAAMEQAWRRRATLRHPHRLRPWLDQIIVREAIRQNRRLWWARFQRATAEETASIPDRRATVACGWRASGCAVSSARTNDERPAI